MGPMTEETRELLALAELRFQAAARSLAASAQAERAAATGFAEMQAQRAEAMERADPGDPVAMQILAHWQIWAEQEQARRAARQARDRAAFLRDRATAQIELARFTAAKSIFREAKTQARRRAERRSAEALLALADLAKARAARR